jgi:cytochrome c biogenesis protein CcmG/thiol:disulfide interchange protein DsbE
MPAARFDERRKRFEKRCPGRVFRNFAAGREYNPIGPGTGECRFIDRSAPMPHQAISQDFDAFVNGQFQSAIRQNLDQPGGDYRPGNLSTVSFGLRYEANPAVVPQLQINVTRKSADQGALADTAGNADAAVSIARRAWLRAVLGCALGTGLSGWSRLAEASSLAVGKPAPPLVLHTLDGRSIDSRDLLGKVVILTFWATWCEPCREELPLLSAYAARHAKQGLEVLGFSLDEADDLPAVPKVAAGLSFPVGLLGSAWAGDYGRMWRIPVSFNVGRDGMLVDNGWNDKEPVWTAERLERIVTPLLG